VTPDETLRQLAVVLAGLSHPAQQQKVAPAVRRASGELLKGVPMIVLTDVELLAEWLGRRLEVRS
jgi:hypothetical protein